MLSSLSVERMRTYPFSGERIKRSSKRTYSFSSVVTNLSYRMAISGNVKNDHHLIHDYTLLLERTTRDRFRHNLRPDRANAAALCSVTSAAGRVRRTVPTALVPPQATVRVTASRWPRLTKASEIIDTSLFSADSVLCYLASPFK